MPRNIEIKARIAGVAALEPAVAAMADQGPVKILQDDTFFRCDGGRLKLRALGDATAELIFYRRGNQPGPKQSFYVRAPVSAPDVLRELLSLAYGAVGRVRKQRTLYLVGRTRVHLDTVDGLGEFLEFEVVLTDDEEPQEGVREAQRLMSRLAIRPEDLVDGAYVDLLTR
jgi:adenylate cyclase class IV